MPAGTEDRRVRKTKKAIRNAFAALLATQDINQITVKEIADKADINRKTFYNYYRGIHEVMDEIENSLVQAFD
ncbi:MAG: TetR family transcriptional regulator, partial [Clostridia bacterium]|nr:TetR family transcriptional regulator [Clostridia bacterium]